MAMAMAMAMAMDIDVDMQVKLKGGCQAHRVGYFGSAMIYKRLLPEIESK